LTFGAERIPEARIEPADSWLSKGLQAKGHLEDRRFVDAGVEPAIVQVRFQPGTPGSKKRIFPKISINSAGKKS